MKVLIPVDGSGCSKGTLEWAAATLDKNNTQYYLLSVVPDPMIAEYEIQDADNFLNEARTTLERKGCHIAKAEYVQGDPVECICRYAEDEDVDQVLIGSHGRSGLAKFLLGSVSTAVMERCKKPVFIYRNLREGVFEKEKKEERPHATTFYSA